MPSRPRPAHQHRPAQLSAHDARHRDGHLPACARDIEQAAAYGLADAAKEFTDRGLVVDLVGRDLDKDVVDR
ncbi:hypothetical protein ABZX75_33730 [Streptomyces sp. NPDC003038]|uniref:hypothetical protein n=1 Tax=unclassified Streptomyces TaxID=2593676 RepID=UPI0033B7AF25